MMDALKRQYGELASAWEDGLKQEAKRSAIAFLILYLLALGLCAGIPSLRERLISMVVGTIDSMAVTDSAAGSPPWPCFPTTCGPAPLSCSTA